MGVAQSTSDEAIGIPNVTQDPYFNYFYDHAHMDQDAVAGTFAFTIV
jgi:hypothetical protein